jgi:octanoyl-[GcvH]:protein N-octanoyltransferase
MDVIVERSPRRPSLEVAVSHALVEQVNAGALASVVRLYRPAPTVAFGRLDALRPGFAAAVAAARAHGFTPVLRAPGGHAVAYHERSLAIDEVTGSDDPIAGMQDRFARSAARLAGALRAVGVDSRVGRVPDEFCPGDFTVNARGAVKLVGTAQRVVRRASLLAASVVVLDAGPVREVLRDVYRALELDWAPATAGAVADEVAGVTVDDAERAVLDAYGIRGSAGALDAATLERARALEPAHELRGA